MNKVKRTNTKLNVISIAVAAILPVTSVYGFGFGDIISGVAGEALKGVTHEAAKEAVGNAANNNQQQQINKQHAPDNVSPFGGMGGMLGGLGSAPMAGSGMAGMVPSLGQQQQGSSLNSSYGLEYVKTQCRGVLGLYKPNDKSLIYNNSKTGMSAEEVVSEYFVVSSDLEQKLYDGMFDTTKAYHGGAFNYLTDEMIEDLAQYKARRLGEAFKANPSVSMLAQVIHKAKTADTYEQTGDFGGGTPSVRTEVRTLLALIMLQYPDLVKNKREPVDILRKTRMKYSKLSAVMMARFHLFGEYEEKNIDAFSNYIAAGSGIKYADETVVWALENLPNWDKRDQYLRLMKQSKQMQEQLEKQMQASSDSSFHQHALRVLDRGYEVDEKTAEILGGSDRLGAIKAKADLAKEQSSGDNNLVAVKINQTDEASKVINELFATAKVLDEEGKQKIAEVNRMRISNFVDFKGLQQLVLLQFSQGKILDPSINLDKYFRNTCKTTVAAIQYGNSMDVKSEVSNEELEDLLS